MDGISVEFCRFSIHKIEYVTWTDMESDAVSDGWKKQQKGELWKLQVY